jgi:hypothetical protein
MILRSSRHKQICWNTFNYKLEDWNVFVDGKPCVKLNLFDALYVEGGRNKILDLIQDRMTNEYTCEGQDGIETYKITFKPRKDVIEYNPKTEEETHVKEALIGFVGKEMKKISGPMDINQLNDILNNFAYVVYSNHDKISDEADKLYTRI